jgi:hypothetical protein
MSVLRPLLIAAAVLAGVAGPGLAQDGPRLFQVPEGCTAFLTVQSRSCLVSHHWTCEVDPEGTHWRATLDQDGAFYLSFTDAEFRWLRSWDLRSGGTDTLIEPEPDPASLTELFETGSDSMVFSVREESALGTFQRDYTGYDRLTGESVTVDGRELEVTEFAYEFGTPKGPGRPRATSSSTKAGGCSSGDWRPSRCPTARPTRPITARWNSPNRAKAGS